MIYRLICGHDGFGDVSDEDFETKDAAYERMDELVEAIIDCFWKEVDGRVCIDEDPDFEGSSGCVNSWSLELNSMLDDEGWISRDDLERHIEKCFNIEELEEVGEEE
jgi:hypothetical protein